MLANRFDNLSIADLVERETETRAELEAVCGALEQRLISECPVEIGKVYHFCADLLDASGKPSYLRSRRILVAYVHAARPRWHHDQWSISIQGFLNNPKSTTGDGFNRKIFVMHGWDKIDLSTAEKGPRAYGIAALGQGSAPRP